MGWVRRRPQVGLWVVIVVAVLVAGCDSSSSPEASEPLSIRASGDVPFWGVTGFAGATFGVAGQVDGHQRLVRSGSGRSWKPVLLSGSPDGVSFSLQGPLLRGGLLTITGRGLEDQTFAAGNSMTVPSGVLQVWTTNDGDRWEAGPAIPGVAPFVRPNVEAANGILLLGASSNDGVFHLLRRTKNSEWSEVSTPLPAHTNGTATLTSLWTENGALTGLVSYAGTVLWSSSDRQPAPVLIRSTDQGRTWTTEACPPDVDYTCGGAGITTDGLLIRGKRASTDGGTTWNQITIAPAVAPACPPTVIQSIAKAPRGWIAVARTDGAGGPSTAGLLYSSDGTNWTLAAGQTCPADLDSSFTVPAQFNGVLWTAYQHGPEGGPRRTEVLTSADGRTWTTTRQVRLGKDTTSDPVTEPKRILFPLYDDRGRLAELRGVTGHGNQ